MAQSTRSKTSTCAAIAQSLPLAQYASLSANFPLQNVAALKNHEVRIAYDGHSTYLIESPNGVVMATDYAGTVADKKPNVVTMNRAHSTHYTDYPDLKISHVLKGWNPKGGAIAHWLQSG